MKEGEKEGEKEGGRERSTIIKIALMYSIHTSTMLSLSSSSSSLLGRRRGKTE